MSADHLPEIFGADATQIGFSLATLTFLNLERSFFYVGKHGMLDHISFYHVLHEVNFVADALTKTCHSVEAFIEDQLVSFRCSHCMAFLILQAKAVLEALL